ncbi:PaaI family thioesterase [Pseudooceanicola nitratireducens]|uniref:PaaI family thioesterase n=1 Tax=Pseudooceanicola nitratireducens TaxID=517719 RepID=UPI001C962171|nr:PaaI family thioesterase [Pseudooceanicola nitratireducens]MBY6164339.1 PaaI family thioesterase [Pseudooceanicola nitratireducens]
MTEMPATPDQIQALAPDTSWRMVQDDGFIGHVGPLFARDMGDAPQWIGFRAQDQHRNINGVVQGGMLMTLADRGLGRIARAAHDNNPVATVNFSYDFLGAAKIGQFVVCRPRIVKETRSLAFMEGEVFAGDDLIGRAHGLWKKLAKAPSTS